MAVVSGTCADLTGTATALKKAGAAAMVAYAGRRPRVRRARSTAPSGCRRCRPGPATPRPCSRGGRPGASWSPTRARLHVRPRAASGATASRTAAPCDGTGKSVAALVEHYRGLGSTSADGLQAVEELIGWVPERGGVANIGLIRAVPFPTTVTHYVSTGAVWERTVAIQDAEYGGEYGRLWAPRRTYAGGSTTHDTWFGGPIGSRVSPLSSVTNGVPAADARERRDVPVDGRVHRRGRAPGELRHLQHEFNGKIYADDELVLDMFASVFMNTTVPAGDHRFRVVTDTQRENPFWQLSTEIKTEWAFDSDTPEDFLQVLPMLGIDYRMALSSTNTAPAGRYDFRSGSRCRTASRRCRSSSAASTISWDGGQTWKSGDRPGAATPPARSRCATRPADTPACASRPPTPPAAR